MWALLLIATPFNLSAETVVHVQVRPKPSSLLAGLSHQHVIQATDVQGQIQFDPQHPERCALRAEASVGALEVDAPALRQKLGLSGTLSMSDRAKVKEHLAGPDQLDALRFPKFLLEGQACRVSGPGQLTLQARLTLRGVTRAFPLEVVWRLDGPRLFAQATWSMTHRDFGFAPYRAALGTIQNDERLLFTAEIQAVSVSN